jgi:hypothetical protein
LTEARDLIGYGANPPKVRWPNGARIAISLVVTYEVQRPQHRLRLRHRPGA